jgi:hypothetical protein
MTKEVEVKEEEKKPEPVKMVSIPVPIVQAILDYLQIRPYQEVFLIIDELIGVLKKH